MCYDSKNTLFQLVYLNIKERDPYPALSEKLFIDKYY
jgi:hypothetical protein